MTFELDTGVLWTFALLWAAIVPTPGANSLMVTHIAITRTPSHVALALLGNMTGMGLLATGALLGWAAVLETFPRMRLAVHVLGGLYLSWLGWRLVVRSLRAGAPPPPTQSPQATAADPVNGGDARSMLALGFVTAISNAQAIFFMTSIYAVTGVLRASLATGLASVAAVIVLSGGYLAMLGWLFQRPAARAFYARFRPRLEGAFGCLFAVFGLRLIYREFVRQAT